MTDVQLPLVAPAQAGTSLLCVSCHSQDQIPACAGMTDVQLPLVVPAQAGTLLFCVSYHLQDQIPARAGMTGNLFT